MEFKEVQPIKFGTIEAMPSKLTTEMRLRVMNIKVGTDADIAEAISVMSECFGDKAVEVKSFMEKNMYPLDLQRLQAYLLGGISSVDKLEKAVQSAMTDAIKGAKEDEAA